MLKLLEIVAITSVVAGLLAYEIKSMKKDLLKSGKL
jgi:hypothetical protein